jgi:hypothetical protein
VLSLLATLPPFSRVFQIILFLMWSGHLSYSLVTSTQLYIHLLNTFPIGKLYSISRP